MDAVTLGMAKADAARRRAPMGRPGGTLLAYGNSYGEGFGIPGYPAAPARYTSLLAQRLGLREQNYCVSGNTLWGPIGSQNFRGGVAKMLATIKPGTDSTVDSTTDVVVIQCGQNDIVDAPYTTDPTVFKRWLRRGIQRAREAISYPASSSFFSYGGTWDTPGGIWNSYGAGVASTAAISNVRRTQISGGSFTLTIPASFDGGRVLLHGFVYASQGALFTVTVDGSPVSDWDTRNPTTAGTISVPVYKDLGVLSAGTHTIVATVTAMNSAFYFDGAAVQSATPPLVILPQYTSSPARAVTVETSPVNLDMQAVAAEFTDGNVVFAPCQIPTTTDYWTSDLFHPSTKGHVAYEALIWEAIKDHPYLRTNRRARAFPTFQKVVLRDTGQDSASFAATLVAGTVTVTSRAINGNTRAIIQRQAVGGTPGYLTYTKTNTSGSTAGTIVITSTSNTDTSVVEVFLYDAV